jgi:hypothetical protein
VITQHLVEKIGGDIPIGGVILFPMIGYRGMIPRRRDDRDDHRGSIENHAIISLHQSDILCQRGRDSSDAWRVHPKEKTGGAASRTVQSGGASPKRYTLFH